MILDDLECQNRGFYLFFGDFACETHFKRELWPKSIELDTEKLHIEFSALNIDFNGPSLDFLR